MFTTQTFAALSATVVLGFAACGHAAAAPAGETVSVKISYADLNLESEAGAKAMLHRIRHAAEEVCGREADDPIDQLYEWKPCVNSTTARAVASFDHPLVTALYSGKSASSAMALASNR